MFFNLNLSLFINVCIFMTIMSCPFSKKTILNKLPYQLAKIGEPYAIYKVKFMNPKDEMKMSIRQFYHTLYNAKFVQLPGIGPYNYDDYANQVSNFCLDTYVPYPKFFIDTTINEFINHLKDLFVDIWELISDNHDNEYYYNIVLDCFTYPSAIDDCIKNSLGDAKAQKYEQFRSKFINNLNLVSLNENAGVKFNVKMRPILQEILLSYENKKYEPSNMENVKKLYLDCINVQSMDNKKKQKCDENYKALDKVTYTSRKISYSLFPLINEESYELFIFRRKQLLYHIHKELEIPMQYLNKLLDATNTIDDEYFLKLKSFRALANESYEIYAIRIIAKGYYPLPNKLWKSEIPNK